jgi:dTDP-glucose 4,6-dehydratase
VNALVTGAAGFLGSRLSGELTRRGHRVLGIDNLTSGSLENWQTFAESDRADLIVANIERELPHLDGISIVFHFASPASPRDYAMHPLETMRANAIGLDRCCRFALAHGARVVYASTSEVYGDAAAHPQRENDWGSVNALGPRACHDESKRYGEALVSSYCRAYGLDGRIVRIFTAYGPGMRDDDGRMIPTFIRASLRDEPIPIFGGGAQTRSFCYVDDLVRGIVDFALLSRPLHRVMNLGSDEELSVLEVARLVCSLVGSELRTAEFPLPQDEPVRRRPDLTRAREMIAWRPETPLREGLARTIGWYRENQYVFV